MILAKNAQKQLKWSNVHTVPAICFFNQSLHVNRKQKTDSNFLATVMAVIAITVANLELQCTVYIMDSNNHYNFIHCKSKINYNLYYFIHTRTLLICNVLYSIKETLC